MPIWLNFSRIRPPWVWPRDGRFGSKRGQIGPQIGQIRDFFRSDFSTFGSSSQMYWNLIWKTLRCVPFWGHLTHFGAKPTISDYHYQLVWVVTDRECREIVKQCRQNICQLLVKPVAGSSQIHQIISTILTMFIDTLDLKICPTVLFLQVEIVAIYILQ